MLAVTTSMAGTPAQAASSQASAELAQFTYELIDLDLNDGIMPSIQILGEDFHTLVTGYDPYQSDSTDGPGQSHIAGHTGSATSVTGPSGVRSSVNVTAGTPDAQWYWADSWRYTRFILSPWTGLRLTAVGTIDAGAGEGSYAEAYVSLWNAFVDDDDMTVAENGTFHTYANSGNGTYDLTAYLATQGQAQAGRFSTGTIVQASAANPVPEPSGYAMLLAGACVVGAMARRRRRGA